MKEDYYNRAKGCERKCIFVISVMIFLALMFCCQKTDNCWDCRIVTSFQYPDTTINCDTTQTWCDIEKEWFEEVNTYIEVIPEEELIIIQFVQCKH